MSRLKASIQVAIDRATKIGSAVGFKNTYTQTRSLDALDFVKDEGMMKMLRRIILNACFVFQVAACSIVTQTFPDGEVEKRLQFGTKSVDACSSQGVRTTSITFGVLLEANSLGAGVMSRDITCLPIDSCSAIFFAATAEQATAILRAVPTLPKSCVIDSVSSEKRNSL